MTFLFPFSEQDIAIATRLKNISFFIYAVFVIYTIGIVIFLDKVPGYTSAGSSYDFSKRLSRPSVSSMNSSKELSVVIPIFWRNR